MHVNSIWLNMKIKGKNRVKCGEGDGNYKNNHKWEDCVIRKSRKYV